MSSLSEGCGLRQLRQLRQGSKAQSLAGGLQGTYLARIGDQPAPFIAPEVKLMQREWTQQLHAL